ncbi:MAG: hypothetical protein ACO1O6_12070 [Bacteroidota bacterium]
MKQIGFLLAATTLLFLSCTKDKIQPDGANSNASLSSSGFEGRITYFWNKIEPFPKSANDSITFYHIADVSSPVVNGHVCSATGMEIVGNLCYVTYHVAGAVYGGAIEVFDISTPANPELLSQLILNDTDFNECTISNGKLYAVGGRDVYSSDFTANNTKGGVVMEVTLGSDGTLSNNIRWGVLPSYSGNSVNAVGDYLFIASGSTGGGVFTLNKSDLSLVQADYFDNAKFCDVKNNQMGEKMVVLQGYPEAKLHEYSAGVNNIATKTVHNILSQNVPYNGKAVVHIDNDDVYVCTGANGLMGFHANSLSTPFLEFDSPASGHSNGVDTDPQFIYISNGQEGLIIVNKDDMTIHTIFTYNGSSNYVQANGEYIFVANGKSGLKIIRRVDPLPEENECADRPEFDPTMVNGTYVVNKNHALSYTGSGIITKDFSNFGEFYFCGDLTLKRKMILNNGSYTDFQGTLRVKDLFINPGSTLRFKGNLIVEGNLSLKGTLNFVGDGNTVTVLGNVQTTNGFVVTGNYTSNQPLN